VDLGTLWQMEIERDLKTLEREIGLTIKIKLAFKIKNPPFIVAGNYIHSTNTEILKQVKNNLKDLIFSKPLFSGNTFFMA
jgi:hypothetical protein